MTRVIEHEGDYEAWENVTESKVYVKRNGQDGKLVSELVNGKRVLHITPAERRLNQEIAADDSLDFFKNGVLVPVRLIETTEDVQAIKDNPNLISESDMQAILDDRRAIKAFQARVEAISNPAAVTRFLELARADDKTTARQIDVIEAHLRNIEPGASFKENEVFGKPASSGMNPVQSR